MGASDTALSTNWSAPEVLLGRMEGGRSPSVYRGNARDLSYGALGNLQVDRALAIGCCVALRTGCCFRRDSARDCPHPAALRLPASVRFPLYLDRNRDHFLVLRNRSRSARSLALLFGS